MSHLPLITIGQIYLHPTYNEYMVVTKYNRGDVNFSGPGFSGKCWVEAFLQKFQPVDPADITEAEKTVLLSFGVPNLLVGWFEPYCEED